MRWYVISTKWVSPEHVFAEVELRPNGFGRLLGMKPTREQLFGCFEHAVLRWYYADTGAGCEVDAQGRWAGPAAVANEAAWAVVQARVNPHILMKIAEAMAANAISVEAPQIERT